ncbi:uncharacterized protein [Antennarius striatus]|uniref:uncharacterized protein isoform X2 n=1 Tax=Antennarius striatus TaxID=241820 RepID=UPI0035AF39C1
MSVVGPSQENDQEVPEKRFQNDNKRSEFFPDDKKYKKIVRPLSVFKEDLTQFTEGVLKVFKDKDTKTELEDESLSQAGNKLVSSTLGLLKEDFNQFKEDVTSVFSIRSSKDQVWRHEDSSTSQEHSICANGIVGLLKEDVTSMLSITSSKNKEVKSTEKSINRLSLFKEDFSLLKDDLSNVFRIGIVKEKSTAKEDWADTFKILSRRDQKTFQEEQNNDDLKLTCLGASKGQMDDGFIGNLSIVDGENFNVISQRGQRGGNDTDATVREEETETSLSEIPQNGQTREEFTDSYFELSREEEQEERPSETSLGKISSSGITLFRLRHQNEDESRDHTGNNLWLLRNYACCLTFDSNTANSELHLTESHRKVTRLWPYSRPSEHPDQFKHCPQVLCREAFLDSVYWEALWSGGVDIGVAYNSLSRDGNPDSCLLGHNEQSWSLECSKGSYVPHHNNKRFTSSSPTPFTHRVGVHLDWSAGLLSFYCISWNKMTHIHTFSSTFTEPVYPAFWVWEYDGSVMLCQVDLDPNPTPTVWKPPG